MITKTVNLDSAYDALFAEIKEVSEGQIDIHNLEGLYGNIEQIATLKEGKYLRLPLDEPLFEIDANTRKIDVPVEFRTNGVSVQKDHLAEALFFRIAKFFDYTDLSTCDITINWKMGTSEGKTKRFVQFESVMVEPTDNTKVDCIIFGWPIHNIITEKSGTLQFAIEFSKENSSHENIYRFNTLPAAVTIKDGLVVDGDIEAENLYQDIRRMLTNSSFGEGDAAVGDVTWLTGNGKGLVTGAALDGPGGTVISFNPNDWQGTLNLATMIDNQNQPFSVNTNLIAQAFVDNQTDIRYTDLDGNNVEAAMVKVDENRILVEDRSNLDANKLYYIGSSTQAVEAGAEEIADESVPLFEVGPLNENLIYYKHPTHEENGVTVEDLEAYVEASEEDLAKWGTKNKVDLFAKIATITVDKADTYVLKAQGEKYAPIEGRIVKVGAGDTKLSDPVIVPAAQSPISIDIVGADVENFDPYGENYTIDESYQNVIYCPDDGRNLIATANFDNFGAVQMVWQKGEYNNTGKLVYSNVSEEDTPFTLSNESVLENANDNFYRVMVTNFINNTYSEPMPSSDFRVSKLATPIVNADRVFWNGKENIIAGDTGAYYSESGPLSQRFAELYIENVAFAVEDGNENSDGLIYEWYQAVGDTHGLFDEEVSEWQLVQNSTVNPPTGNLRGGLSNFKAFSAGRFKPVIKNVYNGSVYTKELPSVWVDAY